MNKKTLIGFIAFSVCFSAVLCCCLIGEAQAAAATSSSAECCHPQSGSHHSNHAGDHPTHSPATDGCHCHEIFALSGGSDNVALVPDLINSRPHNPLLAGLTANAAADHLSWNLIPDYSASKSLFSTPVCLRHSVLRL